MIFRGAVTRDGPHLVTKSDSNLFEDGLLVFHQFTENEENPISI